VLTLGACSSEADDPPAVGTHVEDHPPVFVDSVFPIEEEIRRFRAVIGREPEKLSGGMASRDALIDRFVRAVEAADTAGLLEMRMSVEEFGYLYYPHTRYTAPPYELPPGLLWFQIENGSSPGLARLLDRLGGKPLGFLGYACASEPVVEEQNRTWTACSVRFQPPGEEPRELALFGSILERDGVFKFMSYANGF
jgi:hypothetical protein